MEGVASVKGTGWRDQIGQDVSTLFNKTFIWSTDKAYLETKDQGPKLNPKPIPEDK